MEQKGPFLIFEKIKTSKASTWHSNYIPNEDENKHKDKF